MRISDLNVNDVIKIFEPKRPGFSLAIVEETSGTGKPNGIYFSANIKTQDGRKLEIDDRWDFTKVDEPFTRKVDMQEEQDMVHEPPHYQFGKFSARVIIELVGKTYKSASVFYHVGNALKYLMRAPRKNGLQDLKKAKQSVEFAINTWEAEENG